MVVPKLTGSFDVKALGELIVRALSVQAGETIEVARDRLDPNRILVIRHPQAQDPDDV